MSTGESKQAAGNVDHIRNELRQAIRHLSEMSRSDSSFDEFCQQVLTRVVKLTGAHGALLWQAPAGGQPRITHKTGVPNFVLQVDDQLHLDVVLEVIEKKTPLGIESESLRGEQAVADEASAATNCLMLFSPVHNRKKEVCGAIELLQRNDISLGAKEGYLKFLDRIAELFQRWHEHHDLARLSYNAENASTTMDFVTEVHRSIDFAETAFAIANESRRVLNSDRVSFAHWNGSKCKVVSVSSQDRFDNRSNVVRKLGNLATASVKGNLPIWVTGDTEGLPPEIIKRLNDYLDESHCRTIAVLPLLKRPDEQAELEFKPSQRKKPKRMGALIVEYFDSDVPKDKVSDQIALVQNHAEIATANSLEHSQIFLRPVWKRLGDVNQFLFRDHFAKTMTALAALALFTLYLIFFPAELKMRVSGVMQPQQRRNIFTMTEGIVDKVHVDQGDEVTADTTLIELIDPDLEIAHEETKGKLEVLDKELEKIESQVSRSGRRNAQEDQISLWGQVQQLKSQRANLNNRLKLIEMKKAMHVITSPISGTIVTWDVRKRLAGLPVGRKQFVMAVADFDSDWVAELRIPQHQVGYVAAAVAKSDEPLNVEFRVATNPNKLIQGKLIRLADRTDPGQSGVPEFRAIVAADTSELQDLRPGAGLTAKIHCGETSTGFVWFYQVVDWLRMNVFF